MFNENPKDILYTETGKERHDLEMGWLKEKEYSRMIPRCFFWGGVVVCLEIVLERGWCSTKLIRKKRGKEGKRKFCLGHLILKKL